MADHGGQPEISPGVAAFDVTDLKVSKETGVPPFNILKPNTKFTITATFTGKDTNWLNMKNFKAYYEASFYAEGIGAPPYDINLGTQSGNLDPSTDPVDVDLVVPAGIPDEGIYNVGVVVTFPPQAGPPPVPGWLGTLGYYEGLKVQVSAMA